MASASDAMNVSVIGVKGEDSRVYNVRPTLIIGIGGSGKEVILRLRRLFYEKYRLTGLPITSYLWMDTDIRNIDIEGKDIDYIEPEVRLGGADELDLRVQPSELGALYSRKHANPHIFEWFEGSIIEPLGTNVITQGAGQIRPLGRLAFYQHFRDISARIRDKGRSIQVQEQINKTRDMGYVVDNILEVVIIASVGGGTGSGSFIDTAFLCKEHFPDAQITGIIFLPQVFDESPHIPEALKTNIRANGYAALKELDYYMSPAIGKNVSEEYIRFVFKWDGSDHVIPAPPFSTVYLLDHTNQDRKKTTDYTDVFQMASEFLLFDMDKTAFSTKKRSNRSNLEQNLHTLTEYRTGSGKDMEYVQYFPNRYSTFGLSQIVLNRARMANAAAYFFARNVVDFWRNEDVAVIQGYEHKNLMGEDKDDPGLFVRLGFTGERMLRELLLEDATNTFYELANVEIDQKFKEIESDIAKYRTAQSGFIDPITSDIAARVRSIVEALTKKTEKSLEFAGLVKGNDLKKIAGNKKLLDNNNINKIEKEVIDLLCDPIQFGPHYVDTLLSAGVGVIKSLKDDVDKTISKNTGALAAAMDRVNDFEFSIGESPDISKYKQLYEEASDLPPFPPFFKKAAVKHFKGRLSQTERRYWEGSLNSLSAWSSKKKSELKSWIKMRYEDEGLKRLVESLEKLKNFLGSKSEIRGNQAGSVEIRLSGLVQTLNIYRENLKTLRDRYDGLYEAYQSVPTSVRNEYLSPHIVYQEAVEDFLSEKAGKQLEIRDICRFFSERYFTEGQLLKTESMDIKEIDIIQEGVREVFNRSRDKNKRESEWLEVKDTLEDYCLKLFYDFMRNEEDKAVPIFKSIFLTDQERMHVISSVAAFSHLRIQNTNFKLPDIIALKKTIGIKPKDNLLVDMITHKTRDHPMVGADSIEEGEEDAIVFFCEGVGFPLYYCGGLELLKRDYETARRDASKIYLRHFEKDYMKYRDIIPPRDSREAKRLADAYAPFIEGLIYGLIRYEAEAGFFYKYSDSNNIDRTAMLGKKADAAIEVIGQSDEINNYLIRACGMTFDRWKDSAIEEKGANPEGAMGIFYKLAALYKYLLEEVYQRDTVQLAGMSAGVKITDMNQYLINNELNPKVRNTIMRLSKLTLSEDEVTLKLTNPDDADRKKMDTNINEWYSRIDSFTKDIGYRDHNMDANFRQLVR